MRLSLSKILIVLTLIAGFTPAANAEGQFLKGCLALKGNESQFRKTTVKWIANQQGETIIAYATINVEDKAAVCGLYMNNGIVPLSELKLSLANSEIKAGRQTLLSNLSFFRNACKGGDCRLCAPCFLTSLDWKPAYARAKLRLHHTENFKNK